MCEWQSQEPVGTSKFTRVDGWGAWPVRFSVVIVAPVVTVLCSLILRSVGVAAADPRAAESSSALPGNRKHHVRFHGARTRLADELEVGGPNPLETRGVQLLDRSTIARAEHRRPPRLRRRDRVPPGLGHHFS